MQHANLFSIRKNPQMLQRAKTAHAIGLSEDILKLSKRLKAGDADAEKELLRLERKVAVMKRKSGRSDMPKKKLFLRFGNDDIHQLLRDGKDCELRAQVEEYPIRSIQLNIRGYDNGFTFSIDLVDDLARYGVSHFSPWIRRACGKYFVMGDVIGPQGTSNYHSWYVGCNDDWQQNGYDFKVETVENGTESSIWITYYGAYDIRRRSFSDFGDFEREMMLLKKLVSAILYEVYKKADAPYPATEIVFEQPKIIQIGDLKINLEPQSR